MLNIWHLSRLVTCQQEEKPVYPLLYLSATCLRLLFGPIAHTGKYWFVNHTVCKASSKHVTRLWFKVKNHGQWPPVKINSQHALWSQFLQLTWWGGHVHTQPNKYMQNRDQWPHHLQQFFMRSLHPQIPATAAGLCLCAAPCAPRQLQASCTPCKFCAQCPALPQSTWMFQEMGDTGPCSLTLSSLRYSGSWLLTVWTTFLSGTCQVCMLTTVANMPKWDFACPVWQPTSCCFVQLHEHMLPRMPQYVVPNLVCIVLPCHNIECKYWPFHCYFLAKLRPFLKLWSIANTVPPFTTLICTLPFSKRAKTMLQPFLQSALKH